MSKIISRRQNDLLTLDKAKRSKKIKQQLGICAHVDLLRFEDGIAIVSLESPCVMRFSPAEKGEGEDVDVLLSPGSLILMSGEARYRWKHEINRKQIGFQVWEGEEIDQKRRISITLRKLCPS
ncbi:hypothetical protein F2Q68_00018626 [Brassica cretica]|uniref:Alpha-ketoglutarate-dependent dioxygenase AlkB-like domain-containing protein n=1 Tax=Brassica cretica TaxID=69181 RepID=A0A8S9G3C3_BRACR|nr:hypothetical protein F2Q68_00018626 [Brassica cretica]